MPQDRIDRWTARAACLVAAIAVLLGLVVRLDNVLRSPLWLDEAYSRFAAEKSWWFLWHVVPRYETHPPFYYSLLHLWQQAAGNSLLAYRLPSLIFGLATIAVVGFAARALANRIAATPNIRTTMVCIAVGYAALCPMLIDMSRQVRPYALMVLVYAAATLVLLRLEADAAERRTLSRRCIAMYFTAEALMLWLHSLGPLFAVAMSLALALCVVRRTMPLADWAWLAAGQVAAGLLYLPAFAILLEQAPTWVHSTWLTFDPRAVPDQLCALYAGPWRPLGFYAAIAFAGGMAQFVRRGAAHRIGAALLVLAALPMLVALLLSWWVSPVFLPHTLSPVVAPFTLGIAMLATNLRPRMAGPVLSVLLLALCVTYDFNRGAWYTNEDWAAAADWIAPRVAPGDAVWTYPNETALPLGYALMDRHAALPIRQIPADVPAIGYAGEHPTGNGGVVSVRPLDVERIAHDPAAATPRGIWLIGLAAERIDPRDALLHALLRDRTIGRTYKAGEIRILELIATPAVPKPGRAAPASAAEAH